MALTIPPPGASDITGEGSLEHVEVGLCEWHAVVVANRGIDRVRPSLFTFATGCGADKRTRRRRGVRPIKDRRPTHPSPKVRPIQRPILHRLSDVRGFDPLACAEVRDRACDFQDAVVRARGEAEALDRGDEKTA